MKRITTLAVIATTGLCALSAVPVSASTQAMASAQPRAGQFCSTARSAQPRYRRAGLKCVFRAGHYRLVHR
jgi:hypothetical protein